MFIHIANDMFILILCFKLVVQFLNFNYSNLRFTFLSELQYY